MSMKVRDSFALNPTGNTSKYTDFINYIDTSSVNAGLLSEVSFLEDEFPSRAQRLVRPGDILYSSVRPNLRHYYLYNDSYEHAVASTGFVLLRNKSSYNTRFAFYYLSTNEVVKYLSNIAELSQSTFPSFSSKDIGKIDLPDINRKAQDQIVSILSAYDKLIEVNKKRIKMLEQIAENLYKEWFVRFRFPGHETAEFENGIPKGWQISRMEDFCYVTDGTHDTPKPTENGVPLVTGKFIEDGEISFDEAYLISEADHEAIKKRSGLSTGDILFSNIGTVGKSCIVDYQREFSVKNVIVFKPDGFNKALFLYYWLTSPTMQEIFSTQTNGASQQFVGLTFMRRYKIMVPPQTVLSQFEEQIYPIYQLQVLLRNNRKNLIKQRDLLLPRLMSGKLEA